MKDKFVQAHMTVAEQYAQLSTAERHKVAAIIVKDGRVISIGYNGTPSGWDNACEDENGVTKPEVIHAEANAILKLARSTESGEGAAMFVTLSPCIECAKLIDGAGISAVFYRDEYRSTAGIEFLRKRGVHVQQVARS